MLVSSPAPDNDDVLIRVGILAIPTGLRAGFMVNGRIGLAEP
jgi:hypothetical protein